MTEGDFLKTASIWIADRKAVLEFVSVVIAIVALIISIIKTRRELTAVARETGGQLKEINEAIGLMNKAISDAAYAELDRFYSEILKLAMARPELRMAAPFEDQHIVATDYDPFPTVTGSEKVSLMATYDSYAYMVWNFLETIRDRCKSDEDLRATWAPVIAAENELHRGWFMQQMRIEAHKCKRHGADYVCGEKFNRSFQVFVVERRWTRRGNDYPHWVKDTPSVFDHHPAYLIDGETVRLPDLI